MFCETLTSGAVPSSVILSLTEFSFGYSASKPLILKNLPLPSGFGFSWPLISTDQLPAWIDELGVEREHVVAREGGIARHGEVDDCTDLDRDSGLEDPVGGDLCGLYLEGAPDGSKAAGEQQNDCDANERVHGVFSVSFSNSGSIPSSNMVRPSDFCRASSSFVSLAISSRSRMRGASATEASTTTAAM